MADKYTKVEPKIHPITLFAIIGFFVVSISIIFILQPKNQDVIYAAYEVNATSDLTEDHPYYQVTYDGSLFHRGLDTILKKDEIVALYLGFPECPSCQAHIGAFEKYFHSEGFDEYVSIIYYIDANEDAKGVAKLMELYPEIAATTPQLIIFMNGEVIDTFEPVSGDDATLINRSVRDYYQDVIATINEN